MNPLKLIRKFVKLVRGGAHPWQIFLGCLLGVMIGMVPGFNMTVVLLVVVLLLGSATLGLAIIGFAIGKALCLALAPLTFQIGYVLIHHSGLEGLFRAASETPVVALMNLHYYCLVGGLPIALVAGAAMGLAVGHVIRLVRVGSLGAAEKSEKLQRLIANPVVRVLMRIVFGKQKKSLAEMLAARHPMFRKSGLVVCVVVVGAVLVLEFVFIDTIVKAGLKRGLESAVGAEVNVADVDVSLLAGRMTITDLQVTDPEKPSHNAVQLATLTSDVSIAGLLARRVVVEKVQIASLRTDAPRAAPGKVFEKPPRPEPEITSETISEYFENGKKILEYLRKAKEYLDRRRESQEQKDQPVNKDDLKALARSRGYLALSARSVLVRRPAVTIRELRIDDIRVGADATRYDLEATDVSEKPELNENPMRLALRSGAGLAAALKFDFTAPGRMHAIRVKAPNVPVGQGVRLTDRVPVNLADAKVDVLADGEFNNETIRLPVVLWVRDMKATGRAGRGALGLDASAASQIFKELSELKMTLALVGPLDAPRVRVDAGAVLASLTDSLAKAGKRHLASLAGEQLNKLGANLPIDLPSDLKSVDPKDIFDSVGGILRPPKDATDDKPDAATKPKPKLKPRDLLNDLFK